MIDENKSLKINIPYLCIFGKYISFRKRTNITSGNWKYMTKHYICIDEKKKFIEIWEGGNDSNGGIAGRLDTNSILINIWAVSWSILLADGRPDILQNKDE